MEFQESKRGTGRRTLLVGAGNPSRGDDGVGIHVVRRLARTGLPPGCTTVELRGGWIALLEAFETVDRVVVVDAVDAGLPPGSVVELILATDSGQPEAPAPLGHALGLLEVLALADGMGLSRPTEVRVIGIQVVDLSACSEGLSRTLTDTLEESCRALLEVLSEEGG